MFKSFFPLPILFFPSAVIWTALAVLGWYLFGEAIGSVLGFTFPTAESEPVIGLGYFTTSDFLFFYLYCLVMLGIWSGLWFFFFPHPWQAWSILGSALLLFNAYLGVQVSVAINHWRRPFFDAVQQALTEPNSVTAAELYGQMLIFAQIAFVAVGLFTLTRFFASHYVFRWRNAMNDYYLGHWKKLREVEGASQRIQEDTQRFAAIVEDLGIAIVDAVMTLFAFLPLLVALSVYVTELPIVGEIANPLLWAGFFWSVFGTIFLAVVGIRLPGLHFRNQRVEAAFRKELVYGEDDHSRAKPLTMVELFNNVRRNYFRLYFHYAYFNIARSFYLQADNIYGYFILVPTLVAGKITLGIMQQILTAFGQVSSAFQLLIYSWPTIVELLSIHKRLKAFDNALYDKPLPAIDQEFIAGQDRDD